MIADEKHKLKVEVIDSGIGIEPERQMMLFQPFKELDYKQDLREVKDNSIGLGLSCTKAILNQLGGDIYLKSSQKNLTVFQLHLPVEVVRCSFKR